MQKKTTVKRALRRKFPAPVVLVTTAGARGCSNVMAVGWVAEASSDPVMFVLGIDDASWTYRRILATREFVVAYPHEGMGCEVLYAGTRHGGKGRDKLSEAGIATQKAVKVRAPLVADAVANFECRLVKVFQPGDCPLVIGRVVAAHENRYAALRRLYTVAPGHGLAGVRRFP